MLSNAFSGKCNQSGILVVLQIISIKPSNIQYNVRRKSNFALIFSYNKNLSSESAIKLSVIVVKSARNSLLFTFIGKMGNILRQRPYKVTFQVIYYQLRPYVADIKIRI